MSINIAELIETSRQELLDIGLRGNTLLHFKPRAVSLKILDEISIEIYKILIEDNKSMSFLPLPKKLQSSEEVQDFDRLKTFKKKLKPNRHTDSYLQTVLSKKELDNKLIRINTESETYFKEQGIDILYLALGFLNWFEDENSEIERKAPLVLIPVSLTRNNITDRFKIKYTEVDLKTNLTLKAKLKTDFLISLPDFNDEIRITDYFKKVKKVIKKENRWSIVENEIHLVFFKFGKFQMYQDLDADNWPKDKQPSDHPIMKLLFGDGFINDNSIVSEVNFGDEMMSNPFENLEKFNFIADSDSSQTEAIIKVKQGKNLVIQGPPGTGKSQTITNIIAESLSENKKILFVSEKMVALEVVKRKLDVCQLGNTVLELHSHKSNKKAVLEELDRTLKLGKPIIENRTIELKNYKKSRNKLDNYVNEIKSTVLNSETNFVTLLGLFLELKREIEKYKLEPIEISDSINWTQGDFINAISIVDEMVNYLKENGEPKKNIFSSSKLINFSPSKQEELKDLLNETLKLLKNCDNDILKLIDFIPLNKPNSFNEIEKLINTTRFLLTKPNLENVNSLSDLWLSRKEVIKNILNKGKTNDEIYRKYSSVLIEAAFEKSYLDLRRIFVNKGNKWWRFLSPEYRKAKEEIKGLFKTNIKSNNKILVFRHYPVKCVNNFS